MQDAGSPPLLAGRYQLVQRTATGGYGEVWRTLDTLLQRTVAVKLLRAEISADSDVQARFRGEARHAGLVTHENIAQIYDYCEPGPDQPAFLVMEYVDGPSLGDMLAAGPLEPGLVMDVVAQCAAGLQAVHQAGLMHRDIKPGNVLMTGDGRVKLTDFGISHVAGSVPVTATGTLIGTPAYLAPERANGTGGSSSSDLYSLGVLAYECLTGEVPFSGDPLQVALAHCTDPLPPLPGDVPAGVAALVGALTAKDPAARPESAAAVAAWAADLHDQLNTGVRGLADTGGDIAALTAGEVGTLTAGEVGTLTAGEVGARTTALPGVPGAATLAPAARADRPPRRRWRLFAVLLPAAAIVTALTAVLLISMLDQSPQHVAAASPSRGAEVRVDGRTLLGKPVPAVRRHLRHLGLDVQVRWRPSNRMPPGRVLSVKPAGLLPSGTTVVLIGTLTPASASPATPTSPGHRGRSGTSRHHHPRQPHPGNQRPPTGSPAPTDGSPAPVSSPTPSVSPTPTPAASPSPSTTLPPPAGP